VQKSGIVSGDDVTVASSGLFSDKNVADDKVVTLSNTFDGADLNNYTIVNQETTTANITPKELTISGITAENKIYDGATSAVVSTANVEKSGLVSGDVVTVDSSGLFSDKNVADGKTVTLSNTFDGADLNNYTIVNQETTTANITPKDLVISGISAEDKIYDGKTTASLLLEQMQKAGLIENDALIVATTGNFSDKNVADGKTVTITYDISGADKDNYAITTQENTTANITRRESVTWVGGATGNWFDPTNWQDGAIPDLANVQNVTLPEGVTVTFDTTGATGLADTSAPVQVDNIGTNGGMDIKDGELNVAQSLELSSLTQSGGTVVANSLEVKENFQQTGTGTIDVTTSAIINQTIGGTQLGDIKTGGTFDVNADEDITQLAGTALDIGDKSTLTSTQGDVTLEGENDFKDEVAVEGKNIAINDTNELR